MFISYKSIIAIIISTMVILIYTISCGNITVNAYPNMGVVVVDAGHGGLDGGVVGNKGIKESDINLQISKILQKKLLDKNIKVIMTREEDVMYGGSKKKDMLHRKEIICANKPDLVISIHTNKFSDTKRCGTQVFYDDLKKGKQFATIMQSYLNDTINKTYRSRSNYNALSGDFFITKCCNAPSIIIECGFISNSVDEALLLDNSFRNDLCDKISDVVHSILLEKTSC